MSQARVRIVKPVDTLQPQRGTLAPDDREYWVEMRSLLLQQLRLIEKKLGISRRCRNCGDDVSVS